MEKLSAPISKDLTVHNFTIREAEDFRKHIVTFQE